KEAVSFYGFLDNRPINAYFRRYFLDYRFDIQAHDLLLLFCRRLKRLSATYDVVILRFCSEAVSPRIPFAAFSSLIAWISFSAWIAFWSWVAWISFCTLRASYVNKVVHILLSDNMTVN